MDSEISCKIAINEELCFFFCPVEVDIFGQIELLFIGQFYHWEDYRLASVLQSLSLEEYLLSF